METAVPDFQNNLSKCSTQEDLSLSIRRAREALEKADGQTRALLHAHLCKVVFECTNDLIACNNDHTQLLFSISDVRAFEVIVNNLSTASIPASKWIENQIIKMIKSKKFDSIIQEQSSCTLDHLSPTQKTLINGLSRLPDILAAKRGKELSSQLLPANYFTHLSISIFNCLSNICTLLKESKDCSIRFLAALIGKASFLGHRDSFWSVLCSKLEYATKEDLVWRRITHSMFSRINQQHLEATLDGILQHITPSLQSTCPLRRIIGDLPLTNSHAKYLLTHKYITIRPVHDLRILIGYLSSTDSLKPLLFESLLLALKLWSDRSSLRHMGLSLHRYLSGVIVLGVNCSAVKHLKPHTSEFQELLMQGIQLHLDCATDDIKYLGMATGEYGMNKLYPSTSSPLKFSYPETESVVWLKSFMRPIADQENEISCKLILADKEAIERPSEKVESLKESPKKEKFGKGFVQATIANDNDSDDDDLQPYDMTNDRDNTLAPTPYYLRQCIQGLLSKDDYSKHRAALRALKPLIESRPSDLPEVCIELIKVLLHLEDIFSMEDFVLLRQEALVELTYVCPTQAAPYLCEQFYTPNYTILQRIDILESLTKAALKLSTPTASTVKEHTIKEMNTEAKPWQQVIEERIKAKTRIISKVPKKHDPVANEFSRVCGHFFFPLMTHYDVNIPTLDLPGRDSLLLGQLLHTLGSIVQLSLNCPLVPVMSTALLDFCWSFKYHNDVSVRRSVLYCMCCLMSVLSSSTLEVLLDKGLDEMMMWIKDVASNDANQQCRQLASTSLSMFNESITKN